MPGRGKSKRSFYQKAKKLGRQGRFGHGNQLSEAEFEFFMQVFQHIRDPEFLEKDLILKNFLKCFDTDENIKHLVTNQIVSRILDEVLSTTHQEKLVFLMDSMSQNLRIFCTDPYASHVIQALLCLALRYYQKSAFVPDAMSYKKLGNKSSESNIEDKEDDSTEKESKELISRENRKNFKHFLIKVSKFVYNNLEEFINDTYASHIIRTVMEVCSGVEVALSLKSSKKAQINHTIIENDSKSLVRVPKDLRSICNELFIRLTQIANFQELILTDCSSAVIQTALSVSSSIENEEMTSQLINHIRQEGFSLLKSSDDYNHHPIFAMTGTSRLLEAMIVCATASEQEYLFKTYYRDQMELLVQHNLANFAVQKLLTSWKNEDTFDDVMTCVSSYLEESLLSHYTGVLYSFVKACRKFKSKQSKCIQILIDLFKCSDADVTQQSKIVSCLLYLLSLPIYEEKRKNEEELSMSLHGTLIIQELLHFNKPIKVIRSLCEQSLGDLQKIACDPRGSHIFNAFNTAAFVGEKSRETLVHKMNGSFTNLACSKHGSRSLEAIWNSATVKSKSKICSELINHSERLAADNFGKFIYKNFELNLFKRKDQTDWQDVQQKRQKKRELLKNFLNDDDVDEPAKKKKKKQKREKDSEFFTLDTGDD